MKWAFFSAALLALMTCCVQSSAASAQPLPNTPSGTFRPTPRSFSPGRGIHTAGARKVELSKEARSLRIRPHPAIHVGGPHSNALQRATAYSTNWSGEVATGAAFAGVTANWIVPAVVPSSSLQMSATWIGIDGWSNQSLIQTGTTQATQSGTTGYFAWIELLPAASEEIAAPVNAGDEMTAQVYEDASPADTWTIYIQDLTQNWYFTTNVFYVTPGQSAEWIEEAPTLNGSLATLANYGSASFSSMGIISSGSGTLTPVDMTNANGIVSFPSPYDSANGSFYTTYGSPITATAPDVTPSVATSGTTVNYSAGVDANGGALTGSVAFDIGAQVMCVANLSGGQGSCTSASAPIGNDVVTALYSGDGNFQSSQGTTRLAVFADPGVYVPLAPVRVCDTRPGNPSHLSGSAAQCSNGVTGKTLGSNGTVSFAVSGSFGVPSSTVTAVVLNVTEVGAKEAGYLTAYPAGEARPTASNLNFQPGQTVPNVVEVGVSSGGDVSIFSPAPTDVVVDLEGYVTTAPQGGAGLYNALSTPTRICDTPGW